MKYPTDIVVDNLTAWRRIHRGHDLDVDMLRRDLAEAQGDEPTATGVKVDEVWLRYVPRVKWCAAVDGWGCDEQGEWHSHWFATMPGTGDAFSIAGWEFAAGGAR